MSNYPYTERNQNAERMPKDQTSLTTPNITSNYGKYISLHIATFTSLFLCSMAAAATPNIWSSSFGHFFLKKCLAANKISDNVDRGRVAAIFAATLPCSFTATTYKLRNRQSRLYLTNKKVTTPIFVNAL